MFKRGNPSIFRYLSGAHHQTLTLGKMTSSGPKASPSGSRESFLWKCQNKNWYINLILCVCVFSMIFNFGTNSPKPLPQPSPSIHESLNCEPPDTAVMADAINNIQPDHQSPPPTVHPSDVITVHPAAGLGSQDHHRLLCKIKVGPASPENTTELEDEEGPVR